jgi:hypothetical protein
VELPSARGQPNPIRTDPPPAKWSTMAEFVNMASFLQ